MLKEIKAFAKFFLEFITYSEENQESWRVSSLEA
jgi:hypothetical protein